MFALWLTGWLIVSPSNQELVFYNARLALRDLRDESAEDVLRLWLLRNALGQRGEPNPFDADFRSAVWVALGRLGYCPDGYPLDDHGVWPIALHNFLTVNINKPPPRERRSPFDAFEFGRQQRRVDLSDVLNHEELALVQFNRTGCSMPGRFAAHADVRVRFVHTVPKTRLGTAKLLRALLEYAKHTMKRRWVRQADLVDARLFDLDLLIVELERQEAARTGRERAREAQRSGLSNRELPKPRTLSDRSRQILEQFLGGADSNWLALERQRRHYLFSRTGELPNSVDRRNELALHMVDAFVKRRDGSQVEQWLAQVDEGERASVVSGDRGRALMTLDQETGFRERGTVALHRGVSFVERGHTRLALNSFALALHHASESRAESALRSLALRWFSYVLGSFRSDATVLETIEAWVPSRSAQGLYEDLLWAAAFRGDKNSFDSIAERVSMRGALRHRLAFLRHLVEPSGPSFAEALGSALYEEPQQTLRFLKVLTARLEREDREVRSLLVENLVTLKDKVKTLTVAGPRGTQRAAEKVRQRLEAILEGDGAPTTGLVSPGRDVFAGTLKIAPSDPLPWPFPRPVARPPDPIRPLNLAPVEWKSSDGEWVFGWQIRD